MVMTKSPEASSPTAVSTPSAGSPDGSHTALPSSGAARFREISSAAAAAGSSPHEAVQPREFSASAQKNRCQSQQRQQRHPSPISRLHSGILSVLFYVGNKNPDHLLLYML